MAEQAKIMTLHDHDTGEAIAPRTDVKALSGEGKKWNYVGFTEDNVIGVVDGTYPRNQNLLRNWYFARDKGPFPINQRGQTEYTGNNGPTIDGWKYGNNISYGTVSVEEDCITISHPGEGVTIFYQTLENVPAGTITFSALARDGTLATITGSYATGINVINFLPAVDVLLVSNVAQFEVKQGGALYLVACKLELGPTQTLAHKEGDKWVLNEVPDYGEELAKCQRYFYRDSVHLANAHGYADTLNRLIIQISTPVTMRTTPSVTFPNFYIAMNGKMLWFDGTATTSCWCTGNGVTVAIPYSQNEVETLTAFAVYFSPGLTLDADL